MARVLKWDGRTLPDELRSMPAGRYLVEPLDEAPALTPEEEEGILAALASIRDGRGVDGAAVRRAIDEMLRH